MRFQMTHAAMLLGFALAAGVALADAGPQQAGTNPISAKPVFLQVLANGVPMRLKIADGTMARISSTAGAVGVTPRITARAVELHVFEIIAAGTPGSERLRQVERRTLALGAVQQFRAAGFILDIEWLDQTALPPLDGQWRAKAPAPPDSPSDLMPAGPTGPCTRCCVTCDDVTACACEVWRDCGHCCCSSEACGPCTG